MKIEQLTVDDDIRGRLLHNRTGGLIKRAWALQLPFSVQEKITFGLSQQTQMYAFDLYINGNG